MALGSSSLQEVPIVIETVLALRPRSVVDLGMGSGKYGYLLREQHDIADVLFGRDDWRLRLVGVEAYADYVNDIERLVYDEVVTDDAVGFLHAGTEHFDVALALDILEHFEPETGAQFLRLALETARFVVVSTPRGFYTQDGHVNHLETHRSWWPARALKRLATDLGASVAISQNRYATLAVFAANDEPRIVTKHRAELVSMLRTVLVPELFWYRLKRGTGPTIPL